jgi:2-alkyl-3-oxoalkanoate reductase
MRIFVAGGSGAIGSRLVPLLVARGHDVVASTRRWPRARVLSRMGATSVVLDALDRVSLLEAVVASEPEIVVHQLSGLTGVTDFRDFDAAFAATNRLRTEGTDHLM